MKIVQLFLSVLILNLAVLSTAQSVTVHSSKYSNQPQSATQVTIASVSVMPIKWDKSSNWAHIERLVRSAAKQGAELVVTPEGVLEGYVINQVNNEKDPNTKRELQQKFLDLGEPLDGPSIQKALNLAKELHIFLTLGFLEKEEENLYNTVIFIDPDGEIIGRYRKTHFAQGYTINPTCYLPGENWPLIDTPFGKVGIIICYDRQLPEPARILAIQGTQILLVPSYGGISKNDGWNTIMLRTRAYENRCPLVFSHPKQNLLIARNGDLIVETGTEDVAIYTVDTSPERYEGRFRNRRPEMYGVLVE